MTCSCVCHSTSGTHRPACTVDTGSSGVAGLPSCSPCDSEDRCDRCGETDGHVWVEGDCVLPHKSHSTKLVTGSQVCVPCQERHEEWLNEIVTLYATLDEVLLAGSIPDETAAHKRPKKAPASPSPLRLDAWALLHPNGLNSHVTVFDAAGKPIGLEQAVKGANLPDIADLLSNWAQACCDAQGWTTEAPDTVSGAAALLRTHSEVMVALPDVDEYDAELRWVRRALRNAHGISAAQPIGRCMSVECRGNVWPNAGSQPKCDRCARRYGHLDLVRLKLTEEGRATA